MAPTSKRILQKVAKFAVVLFCICGFTYQVLTFLFMYWTYPTVVDIQVTAPSYIEMPAISICNQIGYRFDVLCQKLATASCMPSAFSVYSGLCKQLPEICFDNKIPDDLMLIFSTKVGQYNEITFENNIQMAMELDEFMQCSIDFAGETKECNMDNVLGSFYSVEGIPNYCYTIYSKWGEPNKTREKIQKGATMKFKFELNASRRPDDFPLPLKPAYTLPNTPSVQMGFHSPYYLPSPFLQGRSFIGGRNYEIRLKQNEYHLLPAPYQTNCTDYMSSWIARGGKAPVNQLGVIQECRANVSYIKRQCVPLEVDYPHHYNICKTCGSINICNQTEFVDSCSQLADSYNQPCDYESYEVQVYDLVINVLKYIKSIFLRVPETSVEKINAHDCKGHLVWKEECSEINIKIEFEQFEITNLTYNPKFESLEIFSTIGGYMGMWLGISLIAVYDFLEYLIELILKSRFVREAKARKKKIKSRKHTDPLRIAKHDRKTHVRQDLYPKAW